MFPYYLVIPTISAFLCLIAGVICWQYLFPSIRISIFSVALSITVDSICHLYFRGSLRLEHINNAIHNIYCLVDFFLLLFSTYSLLPHTFRDKLYKSTGILFLGSWCIIIYFIRIYSFANYAVVVSSFLLTINFLTTLYYNEIKSISTHKIAVRYLCFSMLIYFCGTFTLFIEIKPFLNYGMPEWFGDINTTFDTVKYLCLSVTFNKFKQQYSANKQTVNGR